MATLVRNVNQIHLIHAIQTHAWIMEYACRKATQFIRVRVHTGILEQTVKYLFFVTQIRA